MSDYVCPDLSPPKSIDVSKIVQESNGHFVLLYTDPRISRQLRICGKFKANCISVNEAGQS